MLLKANFWNKLDLNYVKFEFTWAPALESSANYGNKPKKCRSIDVGVTNISATAKADTQVCGYW